MTCAYAEMIPAEVKYVHNPSFNLSHAEKRLWGPGARDIRVPPFLLGEAVEPQTPTRRDGRFRLSREEEETLFLRFNYAKFRMSKAWKSGRRREARKWHDRQSRTKAQLLEANMPLVPAMAKKRPAPEVEWSELISEGYMAVLRCIECFDVSQGFKFSTYACRAILSAFHRQTSKHRTHRKRAPVSYDPEMEIFDETEFRHNEQLAGAVNLIHDILETNQADMSQTENTVLTRRFPLSPEEKPQTLRRIGEELGLSCERVRRIQRACLSKLRIALRECYPVRSKHCGTQHLRAQS